MEDHSEIPPETLSVDLVEEGVAVEYDDGRTVFYHGVPQQVSSPHQTAPGKDVHVLVTDGSEERGVLVYVDERKTDDEILAASGVGRALLGESETTTLFPGVIAHGGKLRCELELALDDLDGRVFVFEEDQFEERSYELVE
jgi:hypothetical protein